MNQTIETLLKYGKVETPAYFYDTAKIEKQMKFLNTQKPDNFEIFYAMKGNSNPHIIEFFKKNGFGTEIASGGELFLAKKVGFTGEEIIYTGPSKSNEELHDAVKYRLKTIHVESVNEAIRLNSICKDLGVVQNILVRVNADLEVHTYSTQLSGCPSPFGISEEFLFDELPKIFELENIHFQGLHVYNASGILDYKLLLENVQNVFEMVVRLEEKFPDQICEYIDFGGGLGIDYMGGENVNVPAFYKGIKEKIKTFGFENRKLIMEISRYLLEECGTYVCQIRDIKQSRGKTFYITNGGIHHLMAVRNFDKKYPTSVIQNNKNSENSNQTEIVTITGSLCTGIDWLGKDIEVPKAELEDFLYIDKIGAYGFNQSLNLFLSHRLPKEVLVDGENWKVIRERGKREDLLVNIEY